MNYLKYERKYIWKKESQKQVEVWRNYLACKRKLESSDEQGDGENIVLEKKEPQQWRQHETDKKKNKKTPKLAGIELSTLPTTVEITIARDDDENEQRMEREKRRFRVQSSRPKRE